MTFDNIDQITKMYTDSWYCYSGYDFISRHIANVKENRAGTHLGRAGKGRTEIGRREVGGRHGRERVVQAGKVSVNVLLRQSQQLEGQVHSIEGSRCH